MIYYYCDKAHVTLEIDSAGAKYVGITRNKLILL